MKSRGGPHFVKGAKRQVLGDVGRVVANPCVVDKRKAGEYLVSSRIGMRRKVHQGSAS